MEHVILVDKDDNEVGTMEKMAAHEQGLLHRAFSVLLFNKHNELLIHKRAANKYHSASLWTNTCCSHPKSGESTLEAVIRRTKEEMGITCSPQFLFKFIYNAKLDNSLTEHELDHVYVGAFDGVPSIDPAEVESWKFMPFDELQHDVQSHPEKYTHWFKLILDHPALHKYTETVFYS